jgi:hypothetical protein
MTTPNSRRGLGEIVDRSVKPVCAGAAIGDNTKAGLVITGSVPSIRPASALRDGR